MTVRLIGLKESWIEMAASRKDFGIHELGNGGRKAISRGLVSCRSFNKENLS